MSSKQQSLELDLTDPATRVQSCDETKVDLEANPVPNANT